MNLDLSPDELLFRDEVRAFLAAALTPQLREAGRRTASVFTEKRWSLAWQKILHAMPRYLNNRAASIYGGSNEIQRDIIARLVLGLRRA